jgi:hypothetical protein
VTNSEIGEKIFANFEDFGLVYLAEGDNGMRHISTTNRPINSAEDVKGLKIRVPESQLYLDVWSALGATPIGLALPELAPALANGTAEGQDNATYHLVANATYDSIKYFSNINYMWMGCTMAINAAKWASLSGEVQEILKEQAKVAAKYSFDVIPVGTAAEFVPDRNTLFTKPDFHFNRDGEYLQGLAFAAKLFGVDVRKCEYRPSWMDAARAEEIKAAGTVEIAHRCHDLMAADLGPELVGD